MYVCSIVDEDGKLFREIESYGQLKIPIRGCKKGAEKKRCVKRKMFGFKHSQAALDPQLYFCIYVLSDATALFNNFLRLLTLLLDLFQSEISLIGRTSTILD
jgi:hypothetical protein